MSTWTAMELPRPNSRTESLSSGERVIAFYNDLEIVSLWRCDIDCMKVDWTLEILTLALWKLEAFPTVCSRHCSSRK